MSLNVIVSFIYPLALQIHVLLMIWTAEDLYDLRLYGEIYVIKGIGLLVSLGT